MSYTDRKSEMKLDARKDERGSVIIMTAISMLFLLLIVGLCIDVSRIYMIRAEVQNAADAAALTAARQLNGGSTGIDLAVTRAGQVVNTKGFGKAGVSVGSIDFATDLDGTYLNATNAKAAGTVGNIRYVRVTMQAANTSILFASSALGGTHSETRSATAGRSIALSTICDFFPVAVALLDPNPAPNRVMTLNFSQGTGNQAILKDQDYIVLEVPDINGNGAPETAVLSAGLTNLCQSLTADLTFHMTPSANINNGPVQITDGVNTRFDIRANGYSNQLRATLSDGTFKYKPDNNIAPNITYDQYLSGSPTQAPGTTGAYERRILVVPIVDLSTSPQTFNPPRTPPAKFGAFFMKKRIDDPQSPCSQAGNICAHLEVEWIDETTLGIGAAGDCTLNSTITTTVLYR
jgi:Flp pilus assembly protein TadG